MSDAKPAEPLVNIVRAESIAADLRNIRWLCNILERSTIVTQTASLHLINFALTELIADVEASWIGVVEKDIQPHIPF